MDQTTQTDQVRSHYQPNDCQGALGLTIPESFQLLADEVIG
jgi:hypothetical protein